MFNSEFSNEIMLKLKDMVVMLVKNGENELFTQQDVTTVTKNIEELMQRCAKKIKNGEDLWKEEEELKVFCETLA